MRLIRLYITEQGILKDFNLEFSQNPENNISVLIGENGSGKTTVFESITKIFSWFIRDEKPAFEFELEYIVRIDEKIQESSTWSEFKTNYIYVKLFSKNDVVEIECQIADNTLLGLKEIRGSKELSAIKHFIKDNKYKLLPDSIAIYYSGESTNLKRIVETHNATYSEAIRELKETVEPRLFFYYEPPHFNLLFLALLSFEYGYIPELLARKIQYNSIHYFSIKLKKPYWSKGKLNPENDEFWGAKGTIAVFLKQIFELASRKEFTINGIALYFEGEKRVNLHQLKDLYGTEKDFFNILEMTWINDLIESVDISITKYANSKYFAVNSKSLSEGEKQALNILGLNELVIKEDSLALYDEPDTFLHPDWQSSFFDSISFHQGEAGIAANNSYTQSHLLITTHSPMMLSNLKHGEIFLMTAGKAKLYVGNTYGKDSNLILSQTMDTEYRAHIIDTELKTIEVLIKSGDYANAKIKIESLSLVLGESDPTLIRLSAIIKRKEIIGK
jgi:predicted ATP-binding protein involved in virulence